MKFVFKFYFWTTMIALFLIFFIANDGYLGKLLLSGLFEWVTEGITSLIQDSIEAVLNGIIDGALQQ